MALQRLVAPPMTDVRKAELNNLFPKVFEILFETSGQTYIAGMGGEEIEQIADIGMMLASSNESQSVAFRVVFGSTEQMPLRALSYILPPLMMMGKLKEVTGRAPQLQVVFADQISSGLNRLDVHKTTSQSAQFANTARGYIEEFFPELDGSAVFLGDTPLGQGTFLRSELVLLAQALSQHITPETKESLYSKGNGTGRLNPYYAAAHLLMHDRDGSEYLRPILKDQLALIAPKAIVSFGGLQERLFYKVRHELKSYLGVEYNTAKTFQYFTRHHVPPYYMARGGDMALEDVLEGESIGNQPIAQAAVHDLDYLRSVSMSRGELYDFLQRQGGLYEK